MQLLVVAVFVAVVGAAVQSFYNSTKVICTDKHIVPEQLLRLLLLLLLLLLLDLEFRLHGLCAICAMSGRWCRRELSDA